MGWAEWHSRILALAAVMRGGACREEISPHFEMRGGISLLLINCGHPFATLQPQAQNSHLEQPSGGDSPLWSLNPASMELSHSMWDLGAL